MTRVQREPYCLKTLRKSRHKLFEKRGGGIDRSSKTAKIVEMRFKRRTVMLASFILTLSEDRS